MASYKDRKEAVVAGGQGSSLGDILGVVGAGWATHLLARALSPASPPPLPSIRLQFIVLVVPILLVSTICAQRIWSLVSLITCSAVPLWLINSTNSSSRRSSPPILTPAHQHQRQHSFKKSFITIFRSQIMLVTSIAILAVDFNQTIFPKKFYKTETFGISLMDLGVGSFVFSFGIISSISILKLSQGCQHRHHFFQDFFKSIRNFIPLALLGLLRLLFVKLLNYPEHVTEYGIHWNFFFTLSILPFIKVLIIKIYTRFHFLGTYFVHLLTVLGLILCLGYQYILTFYGLQDYVLSDSPRDNFISANREGISSMIGFVIIYLFGITTGCYCLPPYPDYLNKNLTEEQKEQKFEVDEKMRIENAEKEFDGRKQLGFKFLSWCAIWWCCYDLFDSLVSPASRRLANPTYCFWITAVTVSFISGHYFIEIMFDLNTSKQEQKTNQTFQIFESINQHGLVFFLAANLATGLINLSLPTIDLNSFTAMVILFCYISLLLFGCLRL